MRRSEVDASDPKNRRRVVRYTSCPDCVNWSIGVMGNGRIVRHSISFGSVERLSLGAKRRGLIVTPICSGSGRKVSRD